MYGRPTHLYMEMHDVSNPREAVVRGFIGISPSRLHATSACAKYIYSYWFPIGCK
jgi:hypothetical protein